MAAGVLGAVVVPGAPGDTVFDVAAFAAHVEWLGVAPEDDGDDPGLTRQPAGQAGGDLVAGVEHALDQLAQRLPGCLGGGWPVGGRAGAPPVATIRRLGVPRPNP